MVLSSGHQLRAVNAVFAGIKLSDHEFHTGFGIFVSIHQSYVFFEKANLIFPLLIRWLQTYKGAFSYRCSHYFISYLSHGTMLMSGFTQTRSNKKEKSALGYSITRPWIIEFPRSLVNVVVYWNLSMHYWLKTCTSHPSVILNSQI